MSNFTRNCHLLWLSTLFLYFFCLWPRNRQVFRCTDLLTISVSRRENQSRAPVPPVLTRPRRRWRVAHTVTVVPSANQNLAETKSHTYPPEESRSSLLSLRGYVCELEWVAMIGWEGGKSGVDTYMSYSLTKNIDRWTATVTVKYEDWTNGKP